MARPVEWKTPSIERMWLGTQPEDKTRRLRAYLTVMHSDTPLMLNTNYVPQHLLILCCVLRFVHTHYFTQFVPDRYRAKKKLLRL